MKQNKTIRWGIVSTGSIADKFCQDMAFVDNGELVAVAARALKSATEFALKHNIEKAYQGYQALFDDKDIDVVYIATPHNFHYQNVYDALMAGKSVLCEKPMTISSKESKALADLATQKNLFLMEAMWTYFLPALIKAKQWLEQGRIGAIKHIKADFGYPVPYDSVGRMYNPELAGGCLFDMGIYPLAIAQYFSASPITELRVKTHFANSGVEDDLMILAEAGKVKLSLAASFQCRLKNSAVIIGEHGYIEIPDFWRAKQCLLYKMDSLIDQFEDERTSIGLNFEAQAVGQAILANNKEHQLMPHHVSHLLQQQMEQIKALC